MKQAQYSPLQVEDQILTIFTAVRGFLTDIPVDKVVQFHADFLKFMHTRHAEIGKKIVEKKKLDDSLEAEISAAIKEFKETVSYKTAE